MIDELKVYYKKQGISAKDFHCKHYNDCSKGYSEFTTAKEPYIGEKYEDGNTPRLLFLSLDSGSASTCNSKKTMEHLLIHEQERSYFKKNDIHWKATYGIAQSLLKDFIDVDLIEINNYFAHINSAKCCQNKKRNEEANEKLFKNCISYLKEEIEILNPNTIITQGEKAKNVINEHFKQNKKCILKEDKEKCFVFEITINSKKVFWLHTYHPSFINRKNKNFKSNHFYNLEEIENYFGKHRKYVSKYFCSQYRTKAIKK